jgi:hypothetical protein
MTNTNNTLWNKYTIVRSEATNRGNAIIGEFTLIGKRGAQYKTYRTATASNFQFIAATGKMASIEGNSQLPVNLIAG